MIAVKLAGGLGNQMFQFALGRRLSLDLRTELVLDISHYQKQPESEVPRTYELGFFQLRAKFVSEPLENTGYKRFIFSKKETPLLIKENGLSFHPEILKSPKNSLLVGHWPSEKYFKDCRETLLKDFQLKDDLVPEKQRVASEIKSKQFPVSVHVRRGDFVTHPISSSFHRVLPPSYYKKAVSIITKTVKSPHFFVISDDYDWCIKNLKLGYPTTYVEHIPGTGHQDMHLISLCSHHLIANSTFSWWGAWLNPKGNKVVVSPKAWFKDKNYESPDILPDTWIKI